MSLFERALKQRCSIFALTVSALVGHFFLDGLILAAVCTLAVASIIHLIHNPLKAERGPVEIAFGEDLSDRKDVREPDRWTEDGGAQHRSSKKDHENQLRKGANP
jgi:hypothetical protein